MTHIRFLTPFVFCLAAFLVSLVIVYYLNAELESIEEETSQVRTPPSSENDRREDFVEHTHRLISDTLSRSDPVMQADAPSLTGGHVENLNAFSAFLGELEQRYRVIATGKAQHPVLLLGSAPMPLNDQLREIDAEISTLSGAVPQQLNHHVRTIQGHVDRVKAVREDQRRSLRGINEIADGFRAAAAATSELLDELSFNQSADRFHLIALTSSSPAARSASRLHTLLVANSRAGMVRDAEANQTLTFEDYEDLDVSPRVLVADFVTLPQDRDRDPYLFDPSYITGPTIEDVIYNQDLLIDLLIQVNQSLADQLAVTDAVRNRGMHTSYQERALRAIRAMEDGRTSDLDAKIRAFRLLEGDAGDTVESLRSDHSALQLRQSMMNQPFEESVRRLERYANQLEQDLLRMHDEFIRLRTDGIPRPSTALTHAEPDGRIVLIDDASRFYTINLGRADNIRRGTRFMVLGDRDGEQYAKAMLEVVNIMNENYATCRLIQQFDDTEPIYQQDPVFNRFFNNGRFLRVALVGEFRPEVSRYTEERLIRFLQEIGCDVQAEADVNTDVVLLAESRDELLPVLPEIRRYLELTELVTLDEVMVNDVLPYFADR